MVCCVIALSCSSKGTELIIMNYTSGFIASIFAERKVILHSIVCIIDFIMDEGRYCRMRINSLPFYLSTTAGF